MRTLRLCGLTLAVVAAHLAAWQALAGARVRPALARVGVRWLAPGAAPVRQAAPRRLPTTAIAAADAQATPGPLPPPRPAATPRRRAPATPHGAAAQAAAQAAALPRPGTSRPPGRAEPRAGEHGTAHRLEPARPPDAPYPTRAPPTATLRYVLVENDGHGGTVPTGRASLAWAHDATSFSLRVAFESERKPAREWVSGGGFDAAGVAPIRLAERAHGRDKRAVNFDRDGGRVQFSGSTQARALAPGTQDRWSWVAQLAAIAEAASTAGAGRHGASRDASVSAAGPKAARRRVPAGTTWTIEVAGLRGEIDRWVFRVLPDTGLPAESAGGDPTLPPDRAPALLHLLREPERPYDLRVEAWLSPALHHLPIGLRMSTPPGTWSIALWPAPDEPSASGP